MGQFRRFSLRVGVGLNLSASSEQVMGWGPRASLQYIYKEGVERSGAERRANMPWNGQRTAPVKKLACMGISTPG